MDKKSNKYIAVAYKLYASLNGTESLIEEATEQQPFLFISGFGVTLQPFEEAVVNLGKGETFDITLPKEQAFGEFVDERIVSFDREMFCINGHFDHENIFKDAIVPMQNEDGNRFLGRVLEITEDKVKMDMNHPLAGKELNFKGHVVENREATNEEIQAMINRLSGEGCSCGCDDCSGGCHEEHEGHGDHCGCGCGHCH
ncbi:MAG: peptidylprolyl isomerase [Prevotella sp.]